MNLNLKIPTSKFFERVRIALTNAESHAEIKPLISQFGMDETKIAEGWVVFNKAKNSFELKDQEDIDKKVSSNEYKQTFEEFLGLFKRHRNQSLIFFKKHPDFLVKLGIKGRLPSQYNKIFDNAKNFYHAIQKHSDIQEKLLLCKITPETVTDCLSKLNNVMSLRATFDKESGEAQDATVQKNLDLIELKEWIEEFDIIAKIALYDKPQLLESLGIFVRS